MWLNDKNVINSSYQNKIKMETTSEFRKAKIENFLKNLKIGALVSSVILIIMAIPGLINILVVWLKNGQLYPMTEADIVVFKEIKISYLISQWWNIVFSVLWILLAVIPLVSNFAKKEAGWMRFVLSLIVIIGGIIVSVLLGGLLYGFIFSAVFAILILTAQIFYVLIFSERFLG